MSSTLWKVSFPAYPNSCRAKSLARTIYSLCRLSFKPHLLDHLWRTKTFYVKQYKGFISFILSWKVDCLQKSTKNLYLFIFVLFVAGLASGKVYAEKRGRAQRARFFTKQPCRRFVSTRHVHQQWYNYHKFVDNDRVAVDNAIGGIRTILENLGLC